MFTYKVCQLLNKLVYLSENSNEYGEQAQRYLNLELTTDLIQEINSFIKDIL